MLTCAVFLACSSTAWPIAELVVLLMIVLARRLHRQENGVRFTPPPGVRTL